MPDESFVRLPGSERSPLPAAESAGPVDGSERIEITLVTRRRAELPRTASGAPVRMTREELEQGYGTDPADLDLRLAGLGPDVIGESFDERTFLTRLREDDPTRPIGDAQSARATAALRKAISKAALCPTRIARRQP